MIFQKLFLYADLMLNKHVLLLLSMWKIINIFVEPRYIFFSILWLIYLKYFFFENDNYFTLHYWPQTLERRPVYSSKFPQFLQEKKMKMKITGLELHKDK